MVERNAIITTVNIGIISSMSSFNCNETTVVIIQCFNVMQTVQTPQINRINVQHENGRTSFILQYFTGTKRSLWADNLLDNNADVIISPYKFVQDCFFLALFPYMLQWKWNCMWELCYRYRKSGKKVPFEARASDRDGHRVRNDEIKIQIDYLINCIAEEEAMPFERWMAYVITETHK